MPTTRVRPAAVAGMFYPADRQRLRRDVDRLLVGPAVPSHRPKALVAPHAGYVYSGGVAGKAFALLRGAARDISRVVTIGPAHYVALRGIAVPTVDAFETPLGTIALDRHALAELADLPFVRADDAPHAPEHALEVELPFLQMALGEFCLVPLVVGEAAPAEVALVLERVWGGAETLVVISSDLSHYYDYETACRLDAATADLIERAEWRQLASDNACGFLPLAGLLIVAATSGLHARRLALCNSGDTAGERTRVVGYGAWAF
ncbi:MAG TPA: AmmeMemoRadiSam system protein B [Xanthobacteraceae bacterium]